MTIGRILSAGPEVADAERERSVRAAAGALSRGGLLAHPTETVYGLGALSPEMDREIARLKGRSAEHPLLRIGPDPETIRRRHPALAWPAAADRLAAAFWPGPLTLVLDDGGPDGLGVRVEGHPVIRRVLAILEETMSSTSLNESGAPPATTPAEVDAALTAMPAPSAPLVRLEAGELPGGPPSTLVSLRGGSPRILRAGAIGADRVEETLEGEATRG